MQVWINGKSGENEKIKLFLQMENCFKIFPISFSATEKTCWKIKFVSWKLIQLIFSRVNRASHFHHKNLINCEISCQPLILPSFVTSYSWVHARATWNLISTEEINVSVTPPLCSLFCNKYHFHLCQYLKNFVRGQKFNSCVCTLIGQTTTK